MGEDKRQYIRAAKDWLGEAEENLSSGAELRGDLKLMLARAELARVEEKQSPGRKFLQGMVAPLTAAALAAGIALAYFAVQPLATDGRKEHAASVEMAQGLQESEEAQRSVAPKVQQGAELPPSVVQVLPEPKEPQLAQLDEHPPDLAMPDMQEARHAATVVLEQEMPARLPSAEKQKLMQEAGALLRAP